ncbi:MAG: hypothetical protein WCL41_09680 [Betaproteobacteria bacterium]|jgi:hypothetical protein
MNIALFSAYRLLNPLNSAVRSFMPAQAMQSAPAFATPIPLRVARVMEAQQNRQSAGRMVISGRMADVCAELERLAEFENKY